jgi:DNA polymerase eta
MQHVATWREGDEKWAYHDDAFEHIATHKVSLDPYRRESRKILACIKDTLPPIPVQRVEKAGIDEVFLDLSAQIHAILLQRYPELEAPAPYDGLAEQLPPPPTTALDWKTDALVDLDTTETEDDDPDWDDVIMSIGSEIVRAVRVAIREQLKYTCSAGIGRNKMIAKLGSAHKKPAGQTIVRNRAVQQFLSEFKFTKIRNLGGKLGEQVVSTFGTDQVKELLQVSIEQLQSKLGDDSGAWVFRTARGQDTSDVNSRTQLKSMLSAKSFRPSISTVDQATRWLRIFVADIFSRLVEEGALTHKRRPRTINLHHRHGGTTRSRSTPIPTGKNIDEPFLFALAKTLLDQVVVDGRAWPCTNLSLSVAGFEDGPTGTRGIGSFLVKGNEAKAMNLSLLAAAGSRATANEDPPAKRHKADDGGIERFFARSEPSRDEHDDDFGAIEPAPEARIPKLDDRDTDAESDADATGEQPAAEPQPHHSASPTLRQSTLPTFFCPACGRSLPASTKAEHDDWHFAKDLQAADRASSSSPAVAAEPRQPPPPATKSAKAAGPGRPPKRAGGAEKGQRRLVFGR